MNVSTKAFCFRVLTIIIGILLWMIGAAILGFSIYLRVDYWLNQYSSADDELMTYTVSVYIFIAAGAVVVLFCIVGIYGAARPDRYALIVYLVFLPLLLGLIIGAGVYAYVYREEIENSIEKSNLLTELVKTKYGVNDRVTSALNYMQRELECCGGTSYTDYSKSIWATDYSTPGNTEERENKAPLYCCSDWRKYENNPVPYLYCSMYVDNTEGNPLPDPNPNIFKKGCGKAFVELIQDNIGTAAGIAFGIVGILLLAIIFVIPLLYFLRRSPPPREDDVVYEMARTQEKSPYPARGGPYANLYQS